MAVGAALLSFGWMLQAQTQTYYTEFNFNFTWNVVTGADGYTAEITTTWGVEGNIQVALTNKDTGTIAWHFDVVDAVQIEGGVWACQDKSTDDDVFGHHFTRPNDFTLNPGESDTYTFTYNFPRYYSGNYMWCILYYETDTARDVATTSRKALLVSAQIASSEVWYEVIVYPVDRSSTSTFWYADSWYIRVYSVDDGVWTQVAYWWVVINNNWIWIVNLIIEPWYYNIVYNSWSSLASYISWIYISGQPNQQFNFTTWGNLYWVETRTADNDDWFRYQRWGDLPDFQQNGHWVLQWKYDSVADSTDLAKFLWLLSLGSDTYCTDDCSTTPGSIITIWTTQYTVGSTPFVFDLDGSAAVNITDANTLLRNLNQNPDDRDIYAWWSLKDLSVESDWTSVNF